MAEAPRLAQKTRAPRLREPGCCSQRKISSGVCAPLLALAGCRGRLRRRDRDSGRRGSRRHAGGGRRVCVFARGPRALAAGEHERQNNDDEDGACDPCPYGGSAHPALHLHLALHLHSPIEVSGVRHGDLPPSLMSVDRQPRGEPPASAHATLMACRALPAGLYAMVPGTLRPGTDAGHALLSLRSKISWVCVTMAASLPSPRVMRVSSTMVVRPRCSGMQTACAVSPFGTPAKKLVLLSMVAVLPPSGRLTLAVIPPSISPQAITAPPWSTPRRLHNSARTGSSASVRSGERWRTFTPRSLVNAGRSGSAIAVPLLRSMCS